MRKWSNQLIVRALLLLSSILSGFATFIIIIFVLLFPEESQASLTTPIVIFSIIFTISWCVPLAYNSSEKRIDIFHPSILFVLIYFFIFIGSGVWLWLFHDYHSIWVSLGDKPASIVNFVFVFGIISVFSFGLGMRVKTARSGQSFIRKSTTTLLYKKGDFLTLIFVFMVIGGGARLYHLSLFGSLSTDLLRYLSPSASRALGINISQFIVILESMLDWSALLAIFYFVLRYKETGKVDKFCVLLIFIVAIALTNFMVSAKRSGVIPFFLFTFIWYHYLVKRISPYRAAVLFSAGMIIIFGLLMGRIVLPLLTQDLVASDYVGTNLVEVLTFYMDTGEWATFDMIAGSVSHREELLASVGGPIWGFIKYSFSTIVIIIPRAIWPGKPVYEDLSHVYYQELIGKGAGIGFVPTIWGSTYLLFDLLGLIVVSFVLGWLFKLIYRFMHPTKGAPFDIFLYSIAYWMMFHFLRFGSLGFVIIMFFQSMFVGTFAAIYIWRRRLRQ